jgi:hypothetical protein
MPVRILLKFVFRAVVDQPQKADLCRQQTGPVPENIVNPVACETLEPPPKPKQMIIIII